MAAGQLTKRAVEVPTHEAEPALVPDPPDEARPPAVGQPGDPVHHGHHDRPESSDRRNDLSTSLSPPFFERQKAGVGSAEKATTAVAQGPHFGTVLRTARESKALSVHEVASITRISARWISALEQERFEQLPAAVFVVGYVRNLARALSLSPDDLVARYRAQRDSQEAASQQLSHGTERLEQAMRQRKFLFLTLAALALGTLALVFLYFHRR